MGIMNNLLRRERRLAAEGADFHPPAVKESQPPLMLLLPDAGGIASYSLNVFPHARAAEYYLDLTLRGQVPEGAVLFWAVTGQPDANPGDSLAEPLVVIRDTRLDVVYPFSFSGLESAFDFLRHEMKRGLDLWQAMLYWAVPARVEVDFWGRSTIVPPAAPVAATDSADDTANNDAAPDEITAASSDVATADDPQARYLNEGDIAEVVELVQQLSGDLHKGTEDEHRVVALPRRSEADFQKNRAPARDNVDTDILIDFSNASQRLTEARSTRDGALQAWSNICRAMDEALDVYVGRQVVMKLAWNRIVRAIVHAAQMQRRSRFSLVWQNGSVAIAEAVDERRRQVAATALANVAAGVRDGIQTAARRRAALGHAWVNTATALASAAQVDRHGRMMRRGWLNISWTLEEAAYASALERKARAIRGWANASTAIAEAVTAQRAYEGALRAFWSAAAAAFFEASEARSAQERVFRTVWTNAGAELRSAVAAKRRLHGIFAAMNSIERAIDEALAAKAWREQMAAAVTSWTNAAIALKEAVVAEAKMRIAQAGLDEELMRGVEKAVKHARKAEGDVEKDAGPVASHEADTVFGDEAEAAEKTAESEGDLPGGLFPFFRATEGRWEPADEPFSGFNSPRGRFYRRNRNDEPAA